MNRLASLKGTTQAKERSDLKDFTERVVNLASDKVVTPPPLEETKCENEKISGDNLFINIPVLFSLDWRKILERARSNLAVITSPSNPFSYLMDDTNQTPFLFPFNTFIKQNPDALSNYADGHNLKEGLDFKTYRVRGLYKIGYRFVKQGNGFVPTSFFLELTPNVSRPTDYILYSTYTEPAFSYIGSNSQEPESDLMSMESFRLILTFRDTLGNSKIKTITWRSAVLGGTNDPPCCDIPFLDEETNLLSVGGIVNLHKMNKMTVSFETYIAFQAKPNTLDMYASVSNGGNGGIYSMLSGKNAKSNPPFGKSLSFVPCVSFPLNTKSIASVSLFSEKQIELNFVSKQNGYYLGSTFTLPFTVVKGDSNRMSNYVMDETNNSLIWGLFLFLNYTNPSSEKGYALREEVKWTTEKIADDAVLTNGTISHSSMKKFNAVSGDMSCFFCRDNFLNLAGPNNVHLIRIQLTLPLPLVETSS